MSNYLLDQEFLLTLCSQRNQERYARICVFDKEKKPLEYIIGQIAGGSVTIDGSSLLRRTCTLNILTDKTSPLTQTYWSLTHEFELEIGLKNTINNLYDDIVWFPLGHYLINSFNVSETLNNITISISGQDLGAKLNGSFGGTLSSEVDFGVIEEEQSDGSILINQVDIETIIKQSLQQYGLERLENIVINDLPENGLELLEYKGQNPMYMIIKEMANNDNNIEIINYTLDGNSEVYDQIGNPVAIQDIEQYWSLSVQDKNYNQHATQIFLKKPEVDDQVAGINRGYYVAKIELGNTIGYRHTPLVYAGNLILKAGENLGSLLDKIKQMLGEFEYFYDVNGRFVFQKKHIYIQELFSPIQQGHIEPIAIKDPYICDFTNYDLFSNISVAPSIQNIKNDFTIWGTKRSVSGQTLNIHARYAIDKKPQRYCSPWARYEILPNLTLVYRGIKIDNNYFLDTRTGLVYLKSALPETIYKLSETLEPCIYSAMENGEAFGIMTDKQLFDNVLFSPHINDPSVVEYIYQKTAEDQYCLVTLTDNPLYIKQKSNSTEYEQLQEGMKLKKYTDIYQLIGGGTVYITDEEALIENDKQNNAKYLICDWRELIYQMSYDYTINNQKIDFYQLIAKNNPSFIDGHTGYEQYYTELLGFWRTLYNPYDNINCFGGEDKNRAYWNRNSYLHPETMIFWFDFLDTGETEIDKYSVKKIGVRPKVENKSNNKTTIFQTNTPEVLFISPDADKRNEEGYNVLQLPQSMEQMISISSQGRSLIEQVNDLFYNHAYCAESITLSSIPLFWLDPNQRIRVKDVGDLIISKINFNLEHSGMMSLTCTKAITPISY